jgi:hypothetical protein
MYLVVLVRWHMPVIIAYRRLKQEDCEFEVSYIVRPSLKTMREFHT